MGRVVFVGASAGVPTFPSRQQRNERVAPERAPGISIHIYSADLTLTPNHLRGAVTMSAGPSGNHVCRSPLPDQGRGKFSGFRPCFRRYLGNTSGVAGGQPAAMPDAIPDAPW